MLRRPCCNPVRGPCMILCRSLWQDLAKILLTSSKRSCTGPSKKILWRSWWSPLCCKRFLHDFVQVLVRRTCGDPGKILPKRSLREDLADAIYERCLYERSSGMLLGGSSIKILQDPLRQQQVLLWRPCGILLGAPAWRSWSWSFTIPFEKLL